MKMVTHNNYVNSVKRREIRDELCFIHLSAETGPKEKMKLNIAKLNVMRSACLINVN